MAVSVWRNHAIEPLLPLMQPYWSFGSIDAEVHLSGYDDSLAFADHRPVDVELVWLDSSRYLGHMSLPSWTSWLATRLQTLRTMTSAPIILATWLPDGIPTTAVSDVSEAITDCHLADIGETCRQACLPTVDRRSAAIAGTPLNSRAHALIARRLACHWLPGATLPALKAVAIDLDHTLYEGVLGEDGCAGIRMTLGHRRLQELLRSLRERGVFLALVSRNETQDVEALFAQRTDFAIDWADFSAREISWGDKAEALLRVADRLRISTDAIIYVDDNLGELLAIGERLPAVHTVNALPEASLTATSIEYYPGLWRWRGTAEDAIRVADVEANEVRQTTLATSGDDSDYFKSLKVGLSLAYDCPDQLSRIAQLCGKTNQFNLPLSRLSESQLAERAADSQSCLCGISLHDRLTDSGLIGVIVAARQESRLVVEELCISCRALGRKLEDAMILAGLHNMPIFPGCSEIVFEVAVGPRNAPARDWLQKLMGTSTPIAAGRWTIPAAVVAASRLPDGINLEPSRYDDRK